MTVVRKNCHHAMWNRVPFRDHSIGCCLLGSILVDQFSKTYQFFFMILHGILSHNVWQICPKFLVNHTVDYRSARASFQHKIHRNSPCGASQILKNSKNPKIFRESWLYIFRHLRSLSRNLMQTVKTDKSFHS